MFEFGNGPSSDNIIVFINNGFLGIAGFVGENMKEYDAIIPNMNDNVWRHFAWTLSTDGTWIVYINGVNVWSAVGQYYPQSISRSNNYLGKSNWWDPYYAGALDQFRMYSSVQSASDILLLATTNIPMSPKPTGLYCWSLTAVFWL